MSSDCSRVAVIGNYVPRKCGIATFTTDLCEALARTSHGAQIQVLSMNDTPEGYDYPSRVRFEIAADDLDTYRSAAEFLNVHDFDVVCVQHEFGIFGGPDGSYLLSLLEELDVPVVTTLHTILSDPTEGQRTVLDKLSRLTDRFVVMSHLGAECLREVYGVSSNMIDYIPHGIPDVPFTDPNYYKDQFDVEGKVVLLTFGLMSPGKGIEYAIRALPEIVKMHPDFMYIVLGATHPHLISSEGEAYRDSLAQLAEDLGVAQHVMFENRFVSLDELVEYIGAADIFLTPYLNRDQITSGTLAYTLGAGKAIISTPTLYAEELLADGRGALVPFRDSDAIARTVNDLLSSPTVRHSMRKRAYLFGRNMIWSEVAQSYMASFDRARVARVHTPRPVTRQKVRSTQAGTLPILKLDHVIRMTDHVGILQHAKYSVPDYSEGYCTDDNARALVLATLLDDLEAPSSTKARELGGRYLAYLLYAFDRGAGRFKNFLSFSRKWLAPAGSEDSHGRALWSLGVTASRSREPGKRDLAARLFEEALPATLDFTSPRAWAFTLLGICDYLNRFSGHRAVRRHGEILADRLLEAYRAQSTEEWSWFENVLSYDNAKLSHALLCSGQFLARDIMIEAGLESLSWLTRVQRPDGGHFVPIGSNGFYSKGGTCARFDQQPLEAHSTLSACLAAYRVTRDETWYNEARHALDWYLGQNDLGLPLYDSSTGGCYDGLHACKVNRNQGCESTLSFLLALVEMTKVVQQRESKEAPHDRNFCRIESAGHEGVYDVASIRPRGADD